MGKRFGQRGDAMVFALIILSASALIMPQFLGRVGSGQAQVSKSGDLVGDRYSADAAVEKAIWRLRYESGFASSTSPSAQFQQTLNNRTATVNVAAQGTPTPQPTPTATPPETGGHIAIGSSVTPNWVPPGTPTTFTYTLYIQNYGTSKVHLDGLRDILPLGFTYVAGSVAQTGILKQGQGNPPYVFGAPSTVTITVGLALVCPPITADATHAGRTQLRWTFGNPAPFVESGTTAIVTLQATATPTIGNYTDIGCVDASPVDIATVSTGEAAPVTVGWPEYDVMSVVDGVTIYARIQQTSTTTIIRSWEVR